MIKVDGEKADHDNENAHEGDENADEGDEKADESDKSKKTKYAKNDLMEERRIASFNNHLAHEIVEYEHSILEAMIHHFKHESYEDINDFTVDKDTKVKTFKHKRLSDVASFNYDSIKVCAEFLTSRLQHASEMLNETRRRAHVLHPIIQHLFLQDKFEFNKTSMTKTRFQTQDTTLIDAQSTQTHYRNFRSERYFEILFQSCIVLKDVGVAFTSFTDFCDNTEYPGDYEIRYTISIVNLISILYLLKAMQLLRDSEDSQILTWSSLDFNPFSQLVTNASNTLKKNSDVQWALIFKKNEIVYNPKDLLQQFRVAYQLGLDKYIKLGFLILRKITSNLSPLHDNTNHFVSCSELEIQAYLQHDYKLINDNHQYDDSAKAVLKHMLTYMFSRYMTPIHVEAIDQKAHAKKLKRTLQQDNYHDKKRLKDGKEARERSIPVLIENTTANRFETQRPSVKYDGEFLASFFFKGLKTYMRDGIYY